MCVVQLENIDFTYSQCQIPQVVIDRPFSQHEGPILGSSSQTIPTP